MKPSQEAHLARVKERFGQLLDAKYRAGQSQHGGFLFKKRMLPNVIEETLDLAVYVMTLEEQIEEIKNLCASGHNPKDIVDKIQKTL